MITFVHSIRISGFKFYTNLNNCSPTDTNTLIPVTCTTPTPPAPSFIRVAIILFGRHIRPHAPRVATVISAERGGAGTRMIYDH